MHCGQTCITNGKDHHNAQSCVLPWTTRNAIDRSNGALPSPHTQITSGDASEVDGSLRSAASRVIFLFVIPRLASGDGGMSTGLVAKRGSEYQVEA